MHRYRHNDSNNLSKNADEFVEKLAGGATEQLKLDYAIKGLNQSKLANAAGSFGRKFKEELNYVKK